MYNYIDNQNGKYDAWEVMEQETGLNTYEKRIEEAIVGCYEYVTQKEAINELINGSENKTGKKLEKDDGMEIG